MIVCADNQSTHQVAAEIIQNGGVIAYRTDTFYGLGADPLNRKAVEKIKQVKGREDGKPILLLVSDHDEAISLMSTKPLLFDLVAARLWPGPLTIIVPASNTLSEMVTAGTSTVGLRLPANESVRDLVRQCGGKLTATSANTSGSDPAKSAEDVQHYFPREIDLIIDGGEVEVTEPSTVFDIISDPPKVVREGVISRTELASMLGTKIL